MPCQERRRHGVLGVCWLRSQVHKKVRIFVERSMIGDIPVRNPDWTFVVTGPVQLAEQVPCYDSRNPRHTTRELVKYVQCSQRTFSDSCFFSLLSIWRQCFIHH